MRAPHTPRWDQLSEISRRTYYQLLRFGPASRLDLSRTLGLSPASLSRASAPLIDSGLAYETAPRDSAGGRPSVPLDLHLDAFSLIGVSATVENVVVIATDARMGIRAASTAPTSDTQPKPLLSQIAAQIQTVRAELAQQNLPDPLAVALCLGAHIEGEIVRYAPFLQWENVAAAKILRRELQLPVLLTHDLTSLAEAENWYGIGKEVSRFIVVTVGVGTGFALVVDGKVITDENTDFGTITKALLGPQWPDFNRLENASSKQLGEAAYEVGRLVGTAAAFTMPEAVVITGEGAKYIQTFKQELTAGVKAVRHHQASDLNLHLPLHDPAQWARGAATSAIQWALALDKT